MKRTICSIFCMVLVGCGASVGTFNETPVAVQPTNLNVIVVSSNSIELNWTNSGAVTFVSGFNIYRNGAKVGTTGGSNYSDIVSPATTYCYSVTAHNFTSESEQSNMVCVTTPADTLPPTALDTNLVAVNVSGAEAKLQWNQSYDQVGVSGYKIYRNGVYLAATQSTNYRDSALENGTVYCYTVTSVDTSNNESKPSDQACVDTSWDIQTVDSFGNVGEASSIAVDSSGNSHISYIDGTNQTLKYATNKFGGWSIESLDKIGYGIQTTSIAVDSATSVHICYSDNSSKALKYVTNSSGAWVTATLDPVGGDGSYCSLVVDHLGYIHVVYSNNMQNGLKYITNKSGAWAVDTIDNQIGVIGTSLAVDTLNHLHVSYYASGQGLKYASNATGTWTNNLVEPNDGFDSSIAVDKLNNVHLVYYSSSDSTQKYATNVTGTWESSLIPVLRSRGNGPIAIDTDSNIHMLMRTEYTRIESGTFYSFRDLLYVTNNSGQWSSFTIDAGGFGFSSAIVVDAKNKVHISYLDSNYVDLKYASDE